ncbi:hypothetical protein JW960_12305 [candidate division KSB1 bacterium]|nr:hypothetical protein [candidate division KSB1 bacterium]
MIHRIILTATLLLGIFSGAQAQLTATVQSIKGDVLVRRGLDENWQQAKTGIVLREIDSILSGKDGIVVLKLSSGVVFELGSRSELDISDLRNISERDMFLWMMSNKIKTLDSKSEKQPLRIGNVSVVHGESKAPHTSDVTEQSENEPEFEINGARALYNHKLYPNSIIKLHRILSTYSSVNDCGEIHYLLGKSFSALNKNGQAVDEFQAAILKQQEQKCDRPSWLNDARESMNRLQAEMQ